MNSIMSRPGCDEGVTEIIGFVLIMGLVVMMLFILALIVPQMNEAEIEGELALDAVQSIPDLKYDMDLVWEDATLPNVTRSVLIQLSTPKQGAISMLPVFKPNVESATLTAGGSDLTTITIGENTYDNLLRLTYSTSNHYAADSVVMYDAGAVFAGTEDSQSLVLSPSVGKSSDNTLFIVLPRLGSGTTSVSGNSFGVVNYTAEVQMREVKEIPGSQDNPVKIEVVSSNKQIEGVWVKILKDSGVVEADGDLQYWGKVKILPVSYAMKVEGAVLRQ